VTEPENLTAPSFEFPIELGAVRAFVQAMESENPAFAGAAPVIPPTFLVTSHRWSTEENRIDHGIPRARLLHGGQEFRFHGEPPRVGHTLTARQRLTERYHKQGRRGGTMEFVTVTTEFHDQSGRLVAEMSATYIGTAPKGEHS
jgi:hypothetical protein